MLVARVVDSSRSATSAFAAGVVFVGVLLAVVANDTACVSRHPMHKKWRGTLAAYMSRTSELPRWQPPQYVDLRLLYFGASYEDTHGLTVERPPRCENSENSWNSRRTFLLFLSRWPALLLLLHVEVTTGRLSYSIALGGDSQGDLILL